MKDLKQKLARVFDDKLGTRSWENRVDYLIIFMILLSTAEIYVSTLSLSPMVEKWVMGIDIFTLIFFTIEVSLRIWLAPYQDAKYSGLKGRLRYCVSFYGFLDIISTYPIWLMFVLPHTGVLVMTMRILKSLRVMRLCRYAKSFSLVSNSISSKKNEIIVSVEFLFVITAVLTLILYFVEHEAQPENFKNGFSSSVWAFAKYIEDPGNVADYPPVTTVGKVISFIVGFLGVAIIAVPAGIIGAGFSEAIQERDKRNAAKGNAERMLYAFKSRSDSVTGVHVIPPYRSIDSLKARMDLSEEELYEAVRYGDFRVVNLADTYPKENAHADSLAIEHYPHNTSYGCFIDRESKLTIVSPSNMLDPGIGNFAFMVALLGGFNYISREVGERIPYKSFYMWKYGIHKGDTTFADYKRDMRRLLDSPDKWSVTILATSGAETQTLDTNLHLEIGGKKGEEDGDLVKDKAVYNNFKELLANDIAKLELTLDHQKYFDSHFKSLFQRQLKLPGNHLLIHFEWEKILWNSKRILLAKTLASALCEAVTKTAPPEDLPRQCVGFPDYLQSDSTLSQ